MNWLRRRKYSQEGLIQCRTRVLPTNPLLMSPRSPIKRNHHVGSCLTLQLFRTKDRQVNGPQLPSHKNYQNQRVSRVEAYSQLNLNLEGSKSLTISAFLKDTLHRCKIKPKMMLRPLSPLHCLLVLKSKTISKSRVMVQDWATCQGIH